MRHQETLAVRGVLQFVRDTVLVFERTELAVIGHGYCTGGLDRLKL